MTGNRKKAYRLLARAKMKQLRAIFTFLGGKYIETKADARFRIEDEVNHLLHRRSGFIRRMTGRMRVAASSAWINLKRGFSVAADEFAAAFNRTLTRFR